MQTKNRKHASSDKHSGSRSTGLICIKHWCDTQIPVCVVFVDTSTRCATNQWRTTINVRSLIMNTIAGDETIFHTKKKEYTMWSDNDHNARSPVMPFPAWQILKFRFIFLARSLRNVNICFSISHHLRSDRNKSTENVCASKNMIHKNVKTKFRMLAWRLVDFRRKFIHKSTACTGWNLAEAIIIELINFISFGARRIRCYS